MWGYLPSFQKLRPFLHLLNSKNSGPVWFLKTIYGIDIVSCPLLRRMDMDWNLKLNSGANLFNFNTMRAKLTQKIMVYSGLWWNLFDIFISSWNSPLKNSKKKNCTHSITISKIRPGGDGWASDVTSMEKPIVTYNLITLNYSQTSLLSADN